MISKHLKLEATVLFWDDKKKKIWHKFLSIRFLDFYYFNHFLCSYFHYPPWFSLGDRLKGTEDLASAVGAAGTLQEDEDWYRRTLKVWLLRTYKSYGICLPDKLYVDRLMNMWTDFIVDCSVLRGLYMEVSFEPFLLIVIL